MALLCSLIYHLIIIVVRGFFLLPELMFFGCRYFYWTWSQWAQRIFALFPLLSMGRKTLTYWVTGILFPCPFLQFPLSFTPFCLSLQREKMSSCFLTRYVTKFPNPKLFPLLSSPSLLFFVFPGLDSEVHPTNTSQVPSTANDCVTCTPYIKIVQEPVSIWTTAASLIVSQFVFVYLTVSSQI